MKKYCQNIIPALFIIILLLIWEAAVGFFHIPLYVLPSPVQVIRTLFSELGTLGGHAAVTVSEALSGIVISLILSLLLGIVMDCFPIIKQGLYPVLVVTQTVPMIVLAPILIIYDGFWGCPENFDGCPDVLFPNRSQLLRRARPGGWRSMSIWSAPMGQAGGKHTASLKSRPPFPLCCPA